MSIKRLKDIGYLQRKMKSLVFKYSVLGYILGRNSYISSVGCRFVYLLVKNIHDGYVEICIGLDLMANTRKLKEYESLDAISLVELVDAADTLGLLPNFLFPDEYANMYFDNYDRVPYKEALRRFSNTNYLRSPMQSLYLRVYDLIGEREDVFGPRVNYIRG